MADPVLIVCVWRPAGIDWLDLSARTALVVRPGHITADWPPKMPAEPAANGM